MKFFLSIVLSTASVLTAFSQKSSKEPLLFTVNKKPVSVNEFIYLYEKNHKGRNEEFTKAKVEEYLDLYIKFKLKVEEARSRGMDTTAKFKKELMGYKDALRKPYLPDNKLIDSLSLLTYNRLKEEVKAAHILIRVNPDASPADTAAAFAKLIDLKKRIEAGEDFGTLAVQYSEDPSAKANEGSLGYFTAMQMVYPFESAAFNTKPGAVSNPIRTRFGYHIIKVSDRRAAQGEVEVAHVLIRTGKDRDTEKAKQQIFEIYDRLQGGMSWTDICKQYSEDPSSKENGGKLRPFGVGAMASVPEFESVAFSLQTPGEYSSPFATQFGWHIVKLERKIPLPSYAELEANLKSRVSRDERMQTAKERIQNNLRKKYALVENENVKQQVLALADSSLQKAQWKKPSTSFGKAAMFTLQGKSIMPTTFFEYVINNQKPNRLAPAAYFKQLYENFINYSIELQVEDELMRDNVEYRYLSTEYYEGILLFDIMEKEIWNRASEDSLGQVKYFDANKENYKAGERVEVLIYSASKNNVLDPIKSIIARDSLPTDDVLKKNGIRLERGKFEKSEKPVLSQVPWQEGTHTADLNGNYYLVKIVRILPAGLRTFEEARGLLIADYQTFLEKQWIETLKKKYTSKVNAKGKKYVLNKLLQKEG